MIFTFWEGKMPDYIRMCLETWKLPYTMLNYDNLREYTDYDIEGAKRFTLPQVSDAVRAHVLRDNGGYWLDADTIMITGKLPTENVIGDPVKRTHSTGVSHYTEEAKDFFKYWAKYQDEVIANPHHSNHWSVLVNMFTDGYVDSHKEVTISDIRKCRPELDMIKSGESYDKYVQFYFGRDYHLSDIQPIDILVLHNSWTPGWYKKLTREQVLESKCTMSNVLREVLGNAIDADKA